MDTIRSRVLTRGQKKDRVLSKFYILEFKVVSPRFLLSERTNGRMDCGANIRIIKRKIIINKRHGSFLQKKMGGERIAPIDCYIVYKE